MRTRGVFQTLTLRGFGLLAVRGLLMRSRAVRSHQLGAHGSRCLPVHAPAHANAAGMR